jgi:HEAT repeat protein
MRPVVKRFSLAIIFAAGLGPAVAESPSPPPPTQSSLSRNPALVRDWADRVLANDQEVRASAEAALVKGGRRSLPLLRRLLASDDVVHQQIFEIIRQIGPPAIPLLVELLRHERVSFRRFAADASIDLAPDTASIQPALRLALRDQDSMVAADAARALGALGKRASPSVRALVAAIEAARRG